MRKSVTTQELKTAIEDIVDDVHLRGDHYVIERRGRPVAALVPVSVLRAMERGRKRLFALMDEVASANCDTSDDELERIINAEVRAVRAQRRRRTRKR